MNNKAKRLDETTKLYKKVRDACNASPLSTGMTIAVLEQVKYEHLRDNQLQIDAEVKK